MYLLILEDFPKKLHLHIYIYFLLCILLYFLFLPVYVSWICLLINGFLAVVQHFIGFNWIVMYFLRSWDRDAEFYSGTIFKEWLLAYVTAYKFCALNVLDIKGMCVKCGLLSVLVALCCFKLPFVSLRFSVIWRKMFSCKYCSF